MPSSKRLFALAALLLTLVPTLALAATPARPAPKNLLPNPGFEQGMPGHPWMPAAWDTSEAGLSTVFFGRDTFMVHSGHWCVNVANTSTVWPMSHNWSQTLLVGRETWGKTATFSVWTRSTGVEGRAYILVQAYVDTVTRMARIWGVDRNDARERMMIAPINDPSICTGWKRVTFEDGETPWVRREARIYVPAGTNVIFVRCGLLGTGQIRFDDASLTLGPTPPAPSYAVGAELLPDGSFEKGGLAYEWAIPPFLGAKLERDTTVARTGRTSMTCSDFRNGQVPARMGVTIPISCRGLNGKTVRIGGWFKGDSLITSAFAGLYYDTPTGMKQSGAGVPLSGTFDWTESAITTVIPDDAYDAWAWFIVMAPANGQAWIDDVSVVVMPPGSKLDAPPISPASSPPTSR